MIQIIENDIIYKLGQNAKENFDLIDQALITNKDYWWFHLDDYPSGHCIIETTKITNQIINNAERLIKMHSKYDSMKGLKIVYTQIKNINKTNIIGQVRSLIMLYIKYSDLCAFLK
jgi:predicted ribosome quality control (RQC) complex YloA/Tae2 family protein